MIKFDSFRKYFVFFSVFITGAGILIIEVLGMRILAPFYGSTIFTTSSVIGVILGALSLGYWQGGKLADKNPNPRLFSLLILLSGLLTILINALLKPLGPLGYIFGFRIGPIILSLFLFFFPSFILGMISPFALRLKISNVKTSGNLSGNIFAFSTIGSILGSFLSGFFLIPHFGVKKIIFFTGLILISIGFLGLYLFKERKEKILKPEEKIIIFSILFMILVVFYFIPDFFTFEGLKKIILEKDGVYQKIFIFDFDYLPGKTIRVLMLDRGFHSAIFLDFDDLVFNYTKSILLYKILNPEIKRVLFLGGGAYTLPQYLLSENKEIEKVHVVEIESQLYELAQKYFRLKPEPRLKNYISDGRRFLKTTTQKYDLIFVDVFSSEFLPFYFATKEFFELLKERLSENGFVLMNFILNNKKGKDKLLLSEIKTFQSVFENSYFFLTENNQVNLQNFIFLGLKNSKKYDFDKKTLKRLSLELLPLENLEIFKGFILTDDFAPVEYLTSQML